MIESNLPPEALRGSRPWRSLHNMARWLKPAQHALHGFSLASLLHGIDELGEAWESRTHLSCEGIGIPYCPNRLAWTRPNSNRCRAIPTPHLARAVLRTSRTQPICTQRYQVSVSSYRMRLTLT